MEGKHCFVYSNCNKSNYESPVIEYNHNDGISVTGGYVYRGTLLQELSGYYIYADYGSGRIWKLKVVDEKVENDLILKDPKSISSFGVDQNNELYLVSHQGQIYRIIQI